MTTHQNAQNPEGDQQENITPDVPSSDNDDNYFNMDEYYKYGEETTSLIAIPYAELRDDATKRPPAEPFSGRAMWAIFHAGIGAVFLIMSGVLLKLSFQGREYREQKSGIFFAQMLAASGIARHMFAFRVLSRIASELQLKRLSRGKPLCLTAAWILYVAGSLYTMGVLLLAGFLYDTCLSIWVYFSVATQLLSFILILVHEEAARKL